MQFNSIEFFVFFPIVTALYFILPQRYRLLLLLIASSVFYIAFIPEYILVLLFTILVDYLAGILIEKNQTGKKKYLILSIIITCLALIVFKYLNFLNSNVVSLAKLLHWNYSIKTLQIVLPLGLSFQRFQSLSYVIEVYRGRQKAERNFGIYALYVMFYPLVVSGPIERPYNLLHQFREEHPFDYKRVTDGLKLMAWGFFKKLVVADRLALFVNQVYNSPTSYDGLPLIISTIFFAFQIYCDFSGYSDIAIGAAQVMGFKVMENFNIPYAAKSIAEFWKRWHISLSTWLRDYLFLPISYAISGKIGKERFLFFRTDVVAYTIGTMITMLIAGLWHGANWTYIIWGGLFGIYLVFSVWTRMIRKGTTKLLHINRVPWLRDIFGLLLTFSLVCIAWVFFRANNLDDAIYILSHFKNTATSQFLDIAWAIKSFVLRTNNITFDSPITFNKQSIGTVGNFLLAIAGIVMIEISHIFQRRGNVRDMLANRPVVIRWLAYYCLIMAIIFFGVFDSNDQFIYFQF
jgi:alginate O-acetyltransferase complex protein AlgI